MNKKFKFITIALSAVFLFTGLACNRPSSDDRRQSETQDSIRLEQERQDLIERANRMLEGRDQEDNQDVEDTN
jgi:hypothetical protein